MATREKRLAQFDGSGDPPPNQPVEVLCEDHSGTYQLPFACRWIDGHWRNDRTGHYGTLEVGDYYRDRDGFRCATYSQTIYVRGRPQLARGHACRQGDGTWTIVD